MIYKFEQRTPEWYAIRLGKFTASSANDLFMSDNTVAYKKLIYRVAYERALGATPGEPYINDAMQHGIDTEDEARIQFEIDNLLEVEQVGFICHGNVGCSPDGIVGENLVEIKCPQWNTQIDYLTSKKVPLKYYRQMQFQMMVAKKPGCFFYSYHPQLPAFQEIVKRDKVVIDEIKKKLKEAEEKVQKILEVLNGTVP